MLNLTNSTSIAGLSSGWNTVDMETSYGAPANATFAVLQCINNHTSTNDIGARRPGDTISRVPSGTVAYLYESGGAKGFQQTVFAPMDVSGGKASIDLYLGNASATVYVVGYFTPADGVRFSTPYEFGLSSYSCNNAWDSIDLSAYVPPSAKFAVVEIYEDSSYINNHQQIRPTGASYTDISGASYAIPFASHLVPLDTNSKFDLYQRHSSPPVSPTSIMRVHGYIRSGVIESGSSVTIASAGAWVQNTSANTTAQAIVLALYSAIDSQASWKADASTTPAFKDFAHTQIAVIPIDNASGYYDIYHEDVAGVVEARLMGYIEKSIDPITDSATAAETLWKNIESLTDSAGAQDAIDYGSDYERNNTDSANAADTLVRSEPGKNLPDGATAQDTLAYTLTANRTGVGSVTLPAPQITSDYGAIGATGTAATDMPMMIVSATGVSSEAATGPVIMPTPSVLAYGVSGTVGQSALDLALPALQIDATGVYGNEEFGTGAPEIEIYTVSGTGVTGNVAAGALTLPFPTIDTATQFAAVALTLPSMTIQANGVGPDATSDWSGTGTPSLPGYTISSSGLSEAIGTAAINYADAYRLEVRGSGSGSGATSVEITMLKYVVSGKGVAGAVATGSVTLPGYTVSAAGIFSATGTAEITMLFPQVAASGNVVYSESGTTYEVMFSSMNVSRRAVTEFQNFSAHGLTVTPDGVYLAMADGIYRLAGTDDNGTPIFMNIEKVGIDYGTSRVKKITDLYLGMSVSGSYSVDAIADGTHAAADVPTAHTTAEHVHKADMPKGLKGGSVGWGLKNSSGSIIELRDIEMIVETSTHRRKRH